MTSCICRWPVASTVTRAPIDERHAARGLALGDLNNDGAIGAKVRVTAGGRTKLRQVISGGSYLSHHDIRLHFGLGRAVKVDTLEIEWPDDAKQRLADVAVNRVLHVRQE